MISNEYIKAYEIPSILICSCCGYVLMSYGVDNLSPELKYVCRTPVCANTGWVFHVQAKVVLLRVGERE